MLLGYPTTFSSHPYIFALIRRIFTLHAHTAFCLAHNTSHTRVDRVSHTSVGMIDVFSPREANFSRPSLFPGLR